MIKLLKYILILLFVCSSCSSSDDNPKQEELQGENTEDKVEEELSYNISNEELNFGGRMVGFSKVLFLTINNNGNQIIEIEEISDSNFDFTSSILSKKIIPRGEVKVRVVFSPTKEILYENNITIKLLNGNDITIRCIGIGRKEIIATYHNNVRPIMLNNCAISGCHNTETKKAGLDLSDFEIVKTQFQSSSSHDSYEQIRTGQMPLGGPPLDEETIELLESWIKHGFKK